MQVNVMMYPPHKKSISYVHFSYSHTAKTIAEMIRKITTAVTNPRPPMALANFEPHPFFLPLLNISKSTTCRRVWSALLSRKGRGHLAIPIRGGGWSVEKHRTGTMAMSSLILCISSDWWAGVLSHANHVI